MLLYDFTLYFWRAITYEIPVIGGRAQGKSAPSAPSLAERPDGEKRQFVIPIASELSEGHTSATDNDEQAKSSERRRVAEGNG